MSNPSRKKLAIISGIFLIAGFFGIFMGLIVFTIPNFILTSLGVVNISLGIFLGFRVMRKGDKNHLKPRK